MAQKSTHKPVIETILDAREAFTSAEQLLLNQPMIGLETIAAYAKKAGVSSPSILRLVRKLGFPGFADFQSRLRKDLEQRLASPLSKKETGGARARVSQDVNINRMAQRICENIRHLPPASIQAGLRWNDVTYPGLAARRATYALGGQTVLYLPGIH